MKKITIEIKDHHFQRGERGKVCTCPIALALKEKLKINSVAVYGDFININHEITVNTPLIARDFINYFDQGKITKFEPFSFEIEIDRLQLFKSKLLTWLKS